MKRMNKLIKKILNKPDLYQIALPNQDDDIYVTIYFKAGSIYETGKNLGMFHLLEHYVANRLMQYQEPGFYSNGSINQEYMWFTLETKKDKFQKHFKLFIDNIFSNDFTDENVLNFERQSIINEMTFGQSINSYEWDFIYKNTFPRDHNYSATNKEIVNSCKRFSLNDLLDCHKQLITRENSISFISGHKIDKADLEYFVSNFGKASKEMKSMKHDYQIPRYSGGKLLLNKSLRLKGQAKVSLLWPALSMQDALLERIALNMILRITRSSYSEGAMQQLRKIGLYSLEYSTVFHNRFGYCRLSFLCMPQQISQAITIINTTLKEIKAHGLRTEIIDESNTVFEQEVREKQSNNSEIISDLIFDVIYEDKFLSDTEIINKRKGISTELTANVAKKVLNPKTLNVFISSNDTTPTELRAIEEAISS